MVKRLSARSQFDIVARNTERTSEKPSGAPLGLELQHGAKLCKTGLLLPDDLDQSDWEAIGLELVTVDTGLQWAIGDWWAHGEHEYGKRTAVAAAKKLPYEFGSLMNLGTIARKVTPSFRNEALSFSHHVAVSTLQPEDQKKWLEKAFKMKWSVKKLRKQLDEREQRDIEDDPNQRAQYRTDMLLSLAKGACRDYRLDDATLKLVDAQAISELVEAAVSAANTWNKIADDLKRHQQSRAVTSTTIKRRSQEPTKTLILEAAE